MTSLMKFLFPAHLEHPESTGRLELFAKYGPVDEQGRLHGGILGAHVHTDLEIKNMIWNNTREALYKAYNKPREIVEVLVDVMLPIAIGKETNITKGEVRKILRNVSTEPDSDRMRFSDMQSTVFAWQKERLQALIKHGAMSHKDKGSKIFNQSRHAHALMSVTRKEKLTVGEENYAQEKRLHNYTTLLATLEDTKDLADQIGANVVLCRHRGDVNDRWDRYCAVRRTGRSGYVKARNQPRPVNVIQDDGLADKHPGVNSLRATFSVICPVF